MINKTYVCIGGTSFVAELQEGVIYSENGMNSGSLFRILDKKGKIVGCLSMYLSGTLKAVWNSERIINDDLVKLLFLRILPYVEFESTFEEFNTIYPRCIQLYIDPGDNTYNPKKLIQTIKSYNNPQELVSEIVFGGDINEEKLQRDILSYLYEVHVDNPQVMTNTGDLAKALFVDEKMLFRCLKYLKDEGHIEGKATIDAGGIVYSNITTPGAKYVRSNFQQIYSGTGVIIMGDYVGKDKIMTTVNGHGNNTQIKSTIANSFNITEVHQKSDKLIESIEQEYHGDDKEDLITQVKEVKTLSSDEKNFPKIREILGSVMNRTAQAIAIAKAAFELYGMFMGGAGK